MSHRLCCVCEGVNPAYNSMLPSHMLQQQQQQAQQARVNGGTPLPGGLGAASYGLQQAQHQHAGGLQPNMAAAAQLNFAAQQQAQTVGKPPLPRCSKHCNKLMCSSGISEEVHAPPVSFFEANYV